MYRCSIYAKGWNIFARELAAMLAARHIRVETLSEEIAIFPDKVRRLAQSLSEPGNFPILNADEMAELIRKFHLSHEEVLRLNAAIIATLIEKTLPGYIGQEAALSIADTAFPQILAALRQADNDANDPDTKRGERSLGRDNTNERALNAANRSYDDGELALHHCLNTTLPAERIEDARRACQCFEQALRDLDTAEEHIRHTQGWHNWRAEIQQRLAVARAHL